MISNKDPGLAYMREHFPRQLAFHIARPLEVSAERPGDIHHVYYDDLLADPLAQMRKVYRWLGDDWTDATEAGMQQWLLENPQNRYGAHTYSLSEWGFSKKDLEPYFSDYLRVHPVATSQEA